MAYGCSPSDYRSRHRDAAETEQHRKEQQDNALLQELAERPAFTGSGDEARELPEQRVTAEGPEERQEVLFSGKDGGKPFTQKWDEVINIGSFHDATLANIQYHILYLQENLHFRYVRLWNVFSRKLQITDENAAGTYNFSMVDQVLDFFTEHHLNVYLDIGRRPDTIVRSGSEIVHKEEEYIVFEDRGSWEDMLRSFIQHIIRRYGREVVSGWIFEASRDGIHDSEEACYYFDGGKPGEYAAAYGFFCRLMREELPEARIAAIGAVIYWDWDYLRCFLEQCRQDKLLPDYVSIILYPYRPYREGKTVSKWIAADAGSEREQVGMIHELLDNVGIPDMKVCVSEWNHTISDRNILNDSSFRAAYFAEKLGETRDSVDLVCIMTGSDWISSYADFCGIADGGIGLLTKDTIGKPGFFALQLMEHMGDNVILEKEHVLITRKKDRDYFILCSNLKWFSQRYFLSGENIRLEDDPLNIPGEVFSDLKPLKITFTVADMEAGREYNVRKRRIRDGEGSILGEWKKLGYDRELTSQDIRYLRTSCYPRMELVRQTADPEKGVLSVSVTLDANEVVLIHIY